MRRPFILALLGLTALIPLTFRPPASAAESQAGYDLVIRNGRVLDGTGNPWFRADVAVRGDTIVRIARRIDEPAARLIDAAGAIVSPGFIDTHTHARRGLNETPTAANYVRQGVTTVIEGPDGSSPVPIGPFFAQLEALQKSVNIGAFIGQGSIRSEVIGNVNRTATPDEIARMKALVEQGMKDGALGLSTGLFYVPGTFTPTKCPCSTRCRDIDRARRRGLSPAPRRRGRG